MKYPWFAPKMQVFESGAVQDMCGEDVSFCLDAIDAGFEILRPCIRVGHEKTGLSDLYGQNTLKGGGAYELGQLEYFGAWKSCN